MFWYKKKHAQLQLNDFRMKKNKPTAVWLLSEDDRWVLKTRTHRRTAASCLKENKQPGGNEQIAFYIVKKGKQ